MEKELIKSPVLTALDIANVKYRIKGSHAQLLDWDSLTIDLTGKYAGSWRRWSNGVHGHNEHDLLAYLAKDGLITAEVARKADADQSIDKEYQIKKTEPYNFKEMVINPHTELIDEYLTDKRHIAPVIVKFLHQKKLIVQDAHDNLLYLWTDAHGNYTGGDVQGIFYDYQKYGKRGTLKLILPGSTGFFHLETGDIAGDYTKVKQVILFEAPVDLISYLELSQLAGLPKLHHTMYISMSGAAAKLPETIKHLKTEFNLQAKDLVAVIATDNDTAGDAVVEKAKPWFAEVKRILPNDGYSVFVNSQAVIPKDWNDYLKSLK